MAYITKEQVVAKRPKLKEINKKYGVKATFSGGNDSTLKLTVQSGSLDFVGWYIGHVKSLSIHSAPFYGAEQYREQTINALVRDAHIKINHHCLRDLPEGKCRDYLNEVYSVMLDGHYDRSDSMTDYFECAWYIDMQVGKWNKGYELVK